ncbi:ribosomal protein S18 acetylase RimI-like enzyme [Neobacillus niacini]|uniref:GNAT family N-acetyltransferase n=1 Tax=Neobacillus driksii TaxID=3035913 RepID=UPI00277F23F7|nr:N-acetyltransferase [Neobacillus niacini]MDQ0971200.1 ribosomal protein S18 acetylase RimI-like enzyme [Neobacillus niacini]
MLDKSIPYFNVIMKRPAGTPIPNFLLPEGYSFAWFTEGKEQQWAEIEASVSEFLNTDDALNYFRIEYLPFLSELKQRVLFIQNEKGNEVGTITGWWNMTEGKRDPSIHWFAVKKEYQNQGLGKALVCECLNRLSLLDGDNDIYLHTQTWSYKAIGIYLKVGFEIMKEESFSQYNNDYELAIPHLKKMLNI